MKPEIINVEIKVEPDGAWVVTPVWSNVDRPRCFSWGLKSTHQKLAARLAKALRAGVVFQDVTVNKDVNGQTYVSCNCVVSGRRLNADLKRLGF